MCSVLSGKNVGGVKKPKTVTEVMRVGKRDEQGGSHMLFNVVLIIELYESATYSKKKRHYLKAF